MRRRIMLDGKPAWSENEPDCHAKRTGWGGSAMGFFSGTTLAPTIRRDADIARQKRRAETKRLWREAHPEYRGRTL